MISKTWLEIELLPINLICIWPFLSFLRRTSIQKLWLGLAHIHLTQTETVSVLGATICNPVEYIGESQAKMTSKKQQLDWSRDWALLMEIEMFDYIMQDCSFLT